MCSADEVRSTVHRFGSGAMARGRVCKTEAYRLTGERAMPDHISSDVVFNPMHAFAHVQDDQAAPKEQLDARPRTRGQSEQHPVQPFKRLKSAEHEGNETGNRRAVLPQAWGKRLQAPSSAPAEASETVAVVTTNAQAASDATHDWAMNSSAEEFIATEGNGTQAAPQQPKQPGDAPDFSTAYHPPEAAAHASGTAGNEKQAAEPTQTFAFEPRQPAHGAGPPGPSDWAEQNAMLQRSLAETAQKAALNAAVLKLQNDLSDSRVSFMKNIGSSVKAAAH
jgi:hypothetical protein